MTLDAILRDLESEDESLRRAAIAGSVKLGDQAVAVLPLLQRLAAHDPAVQIRHAARTALRELALAATPHSDPNRRSAGITDALSKESIPVMAKQLGSSNPDVRASALRAAAIRQDPLLLTVLLDRLEPGVEPEADLRSLQVRALAVLGGKKQLDRVAQFLEDADGGTRATAVEVLAAYRDVAAFPHIVRALKDRDPRPRQVAAAILKAIGPANLFRVCELMMRSDQAWQRESALRTLALTGSADAVPLLEGSLADPEETVRQRAAKGLARLAARGIASAQAAVDRLSSPDAQVAAEPERDPEPLPEPLPAEKEPADLASTEVGARRRATQRLLALEGSLDAAQAPGLLDRLKVENDTAALINLLTALGRTRNPGSVADLERGFINHPDETVRAATADTLATIASPPAVKLLKTLVDDPSPIVVGRALIGLRSHTTVDVTRPLTALAEHTDERFRTTAIYVVGELGEKRFLKLLDSLTTDAVPAVVKLAQETRDLLDPVGAAQRASATAPVEPAAEAAPSTGTAPLASPALRAPSSQRGIARQPPPPAASEIPQATYYLGGAGAIWLVHFVGALGSDPPAVTGAATLDRATIVAALSTLAAAGGIAIAAPWGKPAAYLGAAISLTLGLALTATGAWLAPPAMILAGVAVKKLLS